MSNINLFAKTNFREQGKVFGIKRADRKYHMYIIGKSGMGKTTLVLNMILNDIKNACDDMKKGYMCAALVPYCKRRCKKVDREEKYEYPD